MTEFLNTETHTQVLLMDHLWSLLLREVRIWVNTVFEDQNHKGPVQYLVQKFLVTWLHQITKFSVKVVNLETIIDMQSWCRTWPPSGSSRIRAKQKLLRKHKGACKSSWSRVGSPKSFTLRIPWNLAKPVKISPGIIVRRHHTDRKQMGLLREQYAEWKKVRLLYCCNQVWMKNGGGQILWNVTRICETSQIYCLMGRRPMKDVLGNHLKDRLFHLVHWLSITQNCEGPDKNPSIWKESLTCIVPRIRIVRGWNLEGDVLVADLEELETMDASEIYSKRLNAKEVIFSQRRRRIYFSNRRWTNQNPWRRSGTENIHLDTGTSNSREKSRRFSWRIRRVSTSTISGLHFWMPVKRWMISGPCQGTSYTAITLNHESNFTRREKNHSLFHWNTLTSPELHIRTWMLCKKAASMTIGISTDQSFVWSLDRFHSVYSIEWETSRRTHVVREETDKTASDIQARSFMARTLDEVGKECQAEGEAKVVEWKAPSG